MADPLQKRAYDVRTYEVSLGNAIAASDSISSVTSVEVVTRESGSVIAVDSAFTISGATATAGVVSFTCEGGAADSARLFVRIRCALTGGVQRVEVLVPIEVQP